MRLVTLKDLGITLENYDNLTIHQGIKCDDYCNCDGNMDFCLESDGDSKYHEVASLLIALIKKNNGNRLGICLLNDKVAILVGDQIGQGFSNAMIIEDYELEEIEEIIANGLRSSGVQHVLLLQEYEDKLLRVISA